MPWHVTADAPDWQELVRRRITQLDSDIARLRRARDYLSGSLRCPADHPAADCPYVHREIDDRLNAVGDPQHADQPAAPHRGR